MLKIIFLVSFICCSVLTVSGQNPYVKAELFLVNGEVLKGEVDSTFARKTNVKIFFDDNSSETVSRSQIDSIHCNGSRYMLQRYAWQTILVRILDEGPVDLLEMNGRQLALKQDDTRIIPIFYKKYSKAYFVFCQDSSMVKRAKMSRIEFVELVKVYNSQISDTTKLTNYDWMKSYAKPLTLRLSVFTPSAGVEVKISNQFSFYAGMAINFFGEARGAKTVLNYNYDAEVRYFFMPKKRIEKGKHNYNFTGPYFGGTYNYLVDNGIENASVGGMVFGWQESSLINNTFQLLKIGLGSDFNTGEVYLIGGVSMGWSF